MCQASQLSVCSRDYIRHVVTQSDMHAWWADGDRGREDVRTDTLVAAVFACFERCLPETCSQI